MSVNFAFNYVENLRKLRSLLVNSVVNPDHKPDVTVFMDEEHFDDGSIDVSYFLQDEDNPRCMVVYNDKGVFFYEKKNKNTDQINQALPHGT
jgi:hypothetical protein